MKNNIAFYYFFVVTLVNVSGSCTESSNNRVNFTIGTEGPRAIILPVHLNDSLTANMVFDSGAVDGVFRLDSSFVAAHPSLVPDVRPDTALNGSAWSTFRVQTLIYNTPITVKIGAAMLTYNQLYIYDWRKIMYTNSSDGIFNIPKNDTAHVWEWNFEHNYLEVHPEKDFKMPENCYICPVEAKGYYAYYIRLPLRIKCTDGDTLTIKQSFLVDMGMTWDIALMPLTKEKKIFNQKEDAVWSFFGDGYYRYYTINATLFDNFVMDSIRIYTFESSADELLDEYLVGLNFLKRFNVFFDMKNRQIGLQPIKKFNRIINPEIRRFHYSSSRTPEGKWIVTVMATNKDNYFKTGGLQIGDEIVAINNIPCAEMIMAHGQIIEQQDTLIYDIIRDGKPLKIIIPKDKNEEQGD